MSHEATSWAFKQRGLKPSAWRVLAVLADCHNPAHGCFPSQAYLAEACELNRDTVNVQLAALEKRGLIRRIRSVDPRTKRQRPTRYKLAFEADFDEGSKPTKPKPSRARKAVSESAPRAAKAVSEIPAEPCRKNQESRVGNSDTNLVKEPVMEPCVRSAGAAHTPQDFERFWEAHPRPRNRVRTEKLFAEAVATGVKVGTIVKAAERYRAENTGNKPMYLAYSDNWLERRRWEDFPIAPDIDGAPDRLVGLATFWAKTVKRGGHVPPTAISPQIAAAMINGGMVTEQDLLRAGIRSL